jgi:hypothetical protein
MELLAPLHSPSQRLQQTAVDLEVAIGLSSERCGIKTLNPKRIATNLRERDQRWKQTLSHVRLRRVLDTCSAQLRTNLWQNPHDPRMTSKLPSLLNGVLIAAVAAAAIYLVVHRGGRPPSLPAQITSNSKLETRNLTRAGQGGAQKIRLAHFAPEDKESTDGNHLVAEAARRVQAEPSVQAQIRFRIDATGQNLLGNGQYLQLGDGPEKLLRFDLKLQVAQRTAALQQISGQQYYWVRRDLPPASNKVSRVNLRSIRQAIAREVVKGDEPDPSLGSPASDAWLLLGGLPALLESLHRDFDFGNAREGEIEYSSATDGKPYRLPVWAVSGTWKKERWKALQAADLKNKKAKPLNLPRRIDLVLGRNERSFSLFPYRVIYYGPSDGGAGQGRGLDPNAAADLAPMVSMEFFNVQSAPNLDPRDFDYNPGEQEVEDVTQAYLQKLGLAGK